MKKMIFYFSSPHSSSHLVRLLNKTQRFASGLVKNPELFKAQKAHKQKIIFEQSETRNNANLPWFVQKELYESLTLSNLKHILFHKPRS